MLIIEIKNGDTIDKALKKLKKKFEQTKVVKELRYRKVYTKNSVKRREELQKAIKKQKYVLKETSE